MNEVDYLSSAEATILCFAARYAYNRPTTAPALVVAELVRQWPRLHRWQQEQLQKEIREEALEVHRWQAVLALENHEK